MSHPITLVVDNVRSSYNVGALFRSAEGAGIERIIVAGITPYPKTADDPRLPHVRRRATEQIAKTALGAEKLVPFSHVSDIGEALQDFSRRGYALCALEQTPEAENIFDAAPLSFPLALIVGNEKDGINREILRMCDRVLTIPMQGEKRSLNVACAATTALFYIAYKNKELRSKN